MTDLDSSAVQATYIRVVAQSPADQPLAREMPPHNPVVTLTAPLRQGRLEPEAEERGPQAQSPIVAGSRAVPDAWRFSQTTPEKILELSLNEAIFK